jgi:hypothetical protein
MKNIAEGQQDFKSFEREIFEIMCKIACELMRMFLELRDLSIKGLRDTKKYRLIDNRTTTIKTIMGEVTFCRAYYRKSDGTYVFLLDEIMGIGCGCGQVSENLAEQIVAECTDKSFRKVSNDIGTHTGQCISRMGVWNVFQRYSGVMGLQEARLKELDDGGVTGCLGNVPSLVLFDEYDDVWIPRQKEKRRKRGEAAAGVPDGKSDGSKKEQDKKTGKKPLHVGTAYTGWSQKKDGRFEIADKIAYASFGSVTEFTSNFEMLLRHSFDMDGVEHRVTNGDGESWIRTTAETNDSVLQLDPYHRAQAVIRGVSAKAGRKSLFDAIGKKDVEKALDIICDLIMKEQDEKRRKRLVDLYSYFSNNKDIFLTWQERGMELPSPPDGIIYRNLGTQESSNCNLITQRMKHRKGSWSEDGGTNMAKVLCFKNTIGLDAIMGSLPEPPPAGVRNEPLSAAKAPQHDGRGYGADWMYAQMPFEQAFRTNGREAIRAMVRLKPLSQLSFIQGS